MMNTHIPTAQKHETTFRQDCSVRCDIQANPDQIWALLTDARRFTHWNSTVTSLEGDIAFGRKLALKVTLDPSGPSPPG